MKIHKNFQVQMLIKLIFMINSYEISTNNLTSKSISLEITTTLLEFGNSTL